MTERPIQLDDATAELAAPTFGAASSDPPGSGITPEDWRENIKLFITGILAGIVWLLLAGLIAFHTIEISALSLELAKLGSTGNQAENIKASIALLNDTFKSIYTFMTPLVAGVTTYFFTVQKSSP